MNTQGLDDDTPLHDASSSGHKDVRVFFFFCAVFDYHLINKKKIENGIKF